MKWVGAVKVLEKQVGEWCGECVRGVEVVGGGVGEGYGVRVSGFTIHSPIHTDPTRPTA